jgi:serine/threonine-protein kinase
MGEVYRARDTKLNRDVAIKVLPDSVARDPEHLARFHREAQLLAALNHPNIAHIYGLEGIARRDGQDRLDGLDGRTQALVMELVDGATLAERLTQGPLPLGETLTIARQIAEALEAAHDKGIVHRDLKPANVKVTPDGVVKVLDFGLAKAFDTSPAGTGMMTNSPTLSMRATQAGLILGTAAYMAPEQATGHAVDKRADVWAFGVVLWEMLTGNSLFAGETISHTLAFVITKEPDWNTLPVNTPAPIRRLLRRALEKDRKRRLPDIGSARLDIDEALATRVDESTSVSPSTVGARPVAGWRITLPWSLAAAFGVGFVVALATWAPWRKPSATAPVRLSAELGADVTLGVGGAPGANLALSPDGKLLVFAAQSTSGPSQLYLRRFDQLQASALPGTDDGRNPFFSPDGQWIGFFAGSKLKKISISGGAAVTLCDAVNGRGGTWGEDGTIVFTPNGGPGSVLWRVSDAGGKPESFLKMMAGEASQRWSQLLRGGKAVLFTTGTVGSYDEANIVIQPLPDGPRKIIVRGGYYGRFVQSGHVVYVHGGTLFAAPFDLDRLEIVGRPVPVLEGVNASTGTGGANFAMSDNGTLVYLSGQGAGADVPLFWLDRAGKSAPLRTTPANWSNPRFSPDGTRLAMDIVPGSAAPSVWVYDWSRDTTTRLTFSSDAGTDLKPVWTPDGRRIVFSSSRGGKSGSVNLYWQRSDGTGDVQRLTESPSNQIAGSWHPSGKALAFQEANQPTGFDIKILPIEGDDTSGWKPGKPTVFLNSPYDENDPQFSPDGRWLAYYSNESGQPEVYVRPYPSGVGKWQISTAGGAFALWSRSRSELFYLGANQQIMVASYTAEGGSFRANKPQVWWTGQAAGRPRLSRYDLHPDGNRFALAIAQDAAAKQDRVVFVFNFFDELRRLAPVTK